jgi:hypothetical protein
LIGFIVLALVALIALFLIYQEHRRKLRIPIVVLGLILMATFVSPSFKCAVGLSPTTLATFSWKTISFQHEMCMFGSSMREMGVSM